MGKKRKSSRKNPANAGIPRIERFGSDGSEIRLIKIKGPVKEVPPKGKADNKKAD